MRDVAGVTQDELAQMMVDRGFRWVQTTVTKTEAGNRPLLLDEYVALCEALGSHPSQVLNGIRGVEVEREVQLAEMRSRLAFLRRGLDQATLARDVHAAQVTELEQRMRDLEDDGA